MLEDIYQLKQSSQLQININNISATIIDRALFIFLSEGLEQLSGVVMAARIQNMRFLPLILN